MTEVNEIVEQVNENGFDCAIAIATNAEVKANAACGMMSLINDVAQEED